MTLVMHMVLFLFIAITYRRLYEFTSKEEKKKSF